MSYVLVHAMISSGSGYRTIQVGLGTVKENEPRASATANSSGFVPVAWVKSGKHYKFYVNVLATGICSRDVIISAAGLKQVTRGEFEQGLVPDIIPFGQHAPLPGDSGAPHLTGKPASIGIQNCSSGMAHVISL